MTLDMEDSCSVIIHGNVILSSSLSLFQCYWTIFNKEQCNSSTDTITDFATDGLVAFIYKAVTLTVVREKAIFPFVPAVEEERVEKREEMREREITDFFRTMGDSCQTSVCPNTLTDRLLI